MIDIELLCLEDIGRLVIYRTYGGVEEGIIKSWNDTFIFVVYLGTNQDKRQRFMDYTAAATKPEDLEFIEDVSREFEFRKYIREFDKIGG